jgi:hypothetical protein
MITLTEQEAKLVVYYLRNSNSLIEAQYLADIIEKQLPINHCDYGHSTTKVVKTLPIGDNANAICCWKHFREQVDQWNDDNNPRGTLFPSRLWDDLEVYSTE